MFGLKRADRASLLALGGVVILVGALVLGVGTDYWQYVAAIGAAQAVFGLSIGLVYGQAGMLSLAQVSIGAIGAWTVAKLSTFDGPIGLPWSLFIGAALAVLLGLLCALPALRLRNINLAIVTLGVVLAVYTVAAAGEVPGSSLALFVSPPDWLPGYGGLFLLTWGSFAVLAAVSILLRSSRWGLSWLAIARSERAAASVGVSVTKAKLTAFACAAAIAGWAGGLLVASFGAADPANFDPVSVLSLFALAVMMGAGYWEGALALGAFNAIASTILRQFDLSPDIGTLLFALGAIQVLGAESGGFSGDVRRGLARLRHRFRPDAPDAVPPLRTFDRSVTRGADADQPVVFELAHLTVRYGQVVALDDVSLQLHKGEVIGLIGPNGAGKSTLIDASTGFLGSYSGSVRVNGEPVDALPAHRRARVIRRTFQTERTFHELTPRDYLRLAGGSGATAQEIEEILEFVGCPSTDHTLGSIDVRLRRLIMIAACLVGKPSVLLIDEPAAGLTAEESEDLAARIADIPARFDCGVLLIEHDMEMVRLACSRVVMLDFGEVLAIGPTAEVLADPRVTAAYLGEEVFVAEDGSTEEVAVPLHEPAEATREAASHGR